MALSQAAKDHRTDLAELIRLARRDLSFMLSQTRGADAIQEELRDVLPELVRMYGSAAATLAADWYDDLREKAEVAGRFRAITADLPDIGRTDALAGWAVGPLYGADPRPDVAFSNLLGGFQRIVYNADRETVMTSSIQDRRARGWMREGEGKCEFCQMLIGRGAVYTEATADFESHDRCGCIGVPAF